MHYQLIPGSWKQPGLRLRSHVLPVIRSHTFVFLHLFVSVTEQVSCFTAKGAPTVSFPPSPMSVCHYKELFWHCWLLVNSRHTLGRLHHGWGYINLTLSIEGLTIKYLIVSYPESPDKVIWESSALISSWFVVQELEMLKARTRFWLDKCLSSNCQRYTISTKLSLTLHTALQNRV